ncbi:MAG: hypothetical protein ABIQ49_00780 [Gemmatimonadales bacterium]
MSSSTRLLAILLAGAPLWPGGALPAQTSAPAPAPAVTDSGTFIVRRGMDTVATEEFARTATTLRGTVLLRDAKNTAEAYEAVVAPDASVALVQVTVREDLDGGRAKGKVVQRARVIFKEDSAAVDDLRGTGMETRVFGTERGAVPYLNLSFAMLEQAIRRSRAVSPPAARVPFFNLGGGQTLTATVSALGADSIAVAIGSVEFHLRVDPAGRVLGGTIPAQQVVAQRVGAGS